MIRRGQSWRCRIRRELKILMSTNLRRVKREQGDGNEMAERMWINTLKAVEDAGVDVWEAKDTGVEDGESPG